MLAGSVARYMQDVDALAALVRDQKWQLTVSSTVVDFLEDKLFIEEHIINKATGDELQKSCNELFSP